MAPLLPPSRSLRCCAMISRERSASAARAYGAVRPATAATCQPFERHDKMARQHGAAAMRLRRERAEALRPRGASMPVCGSVTRCCRMPCARGCARARCAHGEADERASAHGAACCRAPRCRCKAQPPPCIGAAALCCRLREARRAMRAHMRDSARARRRAVIYAALRSTARAYALRHSAR